MIKLVVASFLLLLSFFGFSQNRNGVFVKNSIHLGTLLGETPKSKGFVLNEIQFGIKTAGKKYWDKQYNYPELSASLFTGTFGNSKELGYIIGLVPKLSVNLLSGKSVSLKLEGNIGFVLLTKPYNEITNRNNKIIGTYINDISKLALTLNHSFGSKIEYSVGVSAFHFSNGHYQIPNVGINTVSAVFGLKFKLKKEKIVEKDYINSYKNKLKINYDLGIGVHELGGSTRPIGTAKYAIYESVFLVSKHFGRFSNILIGVSGRFYNSYYNYQINNNIEDNIKKSFIVTLVIGHEFLMGNFGGLAYGGINIYSPFIEEQFKNKMTNFHYFTTRFLRTNLGIKYYLHNPMECNKTNYFIRLMVSANFLDADYPKLSFGIIF